MSYSSLKLCNLENISTKKSTNNNIVVIFWWCWATECHSKISYFLENQWLSVSYLNRNWDKALWEEIWTIEKYFQEIRSIIDFLINEWKIVHLFCNSFGWYLGLKISEEIKSSISSIVTVAPIIDPIKAIELLKINEDDSRLLIKLSDWRSFPILKSNIEYLKNNKLNIILPEWLILLWSNDWITKIEELEIIQWNKLKKVLLEGESHWWISSNNESLELIAEFYKKILIK